MIQKYRYPFLITLIASVLFIPYLGAVHLFDWDEINFAESAREMLLTGNYFAVQIDFKPFWEKPPLFIWMQVLSMKIFGINEFAARFPNAIAGIVTLLVLFHIGKRLFNESFGLIWALIYAGTLLTFFYFKSGIIDPWFNLFVFLAVYYFSFFSSDEQINRNRNALLVGLFLGLAVLTKGPVAILMVALAFLVFSAWHRFQKIINIQEFLLITLSTFLICFLWFGVEWIKNGPWFIREFVVYQIRLFTTQDAGHGGPFFYHWIVLLVGCFPASIFALKGFKIYESTTQNQQNFQRWMVVLFFVVLILFSIVKTKIVHYSSLCYFPLTFLAAYAIAGLIAEKVTWQKIYTYLIILFGWILAIAFIGLPIALKNKNWLIPYIKDDFAVANLNAYVPWTTLDSIGGYVLLLGLMIAVVQLVRKNFSKGVVVLFGSMSIAIWFASLLLVPKIELISQAAAIRFFKERVGEDCYVEVLGYKSYAHLFYTQKQIPVNKNAQDKDWLLTGDIDKRAYFVTKIDRYDRIYADYRDLVYLGEENGFIFLMREPPKTSILPSPISAGDMQ